LDTGPLSNCTVLPGGPNQTLSHSQQCRQSLDDCQAAGRRILVPAVAYYEVLRDLERRQASSKIIRLKGFVLHPSRFIPVTTPHFEHAARLWGQAHQSGKPTADPHALDADVIIAAQALSLGLPTSDFLVVTTNPNHLSRFVPVDVWTNIKP
jgi:predicted nucleic acid-binding protein